MAQSVEETGSKTVPQSSSDKANVNTSFPEDKGNDSTSRRSSEEKSHMEIHKHTRFREIDGDEPEIITIYCRTRKTMKKAAGGTTTALATGGALALCGITGGFAAPWVAMGTIGVGWTSAYAGSSVTGYLVNPRVMRFDFENYDEANEAFRQMSTYKVLLRNGEVAQSMGKMRWVAELIGAAVTDESERGPGLLLDSIPEPERRFNILRSPMTYGASKIRVKPWQSFNIKQYTTDYQETADEKWKKISSMNSAILLYNNNVEKTYGKKAYVNELIGWYVLSHTLPAESKNRLKIEDLDDI